MKHPAASTTSRPTTTRSMKSPLSLACLAALAAPAAAQDGPPPSRPEGLRVEVYSDTAAELFWERSVDPNGFVVDYRILRDGEVAGTVYGPSFFTDELEPGVTSVFTVRATDDDFLLSPPATISVTTGRAPGDTGDRPPSDAPPSPANLRTERYSVSAGEVFWDRVRGRALSYEVRLDGEVVATVDGTSYFTGRVGAIDGTRVEVVAIGPDGTRSAVASATFGEDASGPDPDTDPDTDPGPGGDAPPAPANAYLEVYSRSAAELFWDRAPGDADVVETEVVRDGEVLGTTAGTSFFDDARADGVEYRYELIAIDARGERSAPAVVGPDDAGRDPALAGPDLLEVGQELVRRLAGYQLDRLAVVVDDLAFIAGQTTTIVWPDDDYYQVQDAETFDEICNGGAECPVVPGSYVVINQTTGERSPLDVPYVDPADQPGATVLPASTFPVGSGTVPIERTLYGCENGGSLTLEAGTATIELDDFGISGTVERRGYRFDDCRITVRDGLLPDGDYTVRGGLGTVDVDPFDRFSYAEDYDYENLSIVGDDGLEYRVDGTVERSANAGTVGLRRRVAAIDDYAKTLPDGTLAESVTDGRFLVEYLEPGGISPYRETLDADGTVRGTLSAGRRVTITTDPVLTRQLVPPGNGVGDPVGVPFTGRIELVAENGNFLSIEANPIIDETVFFSPALVDLDYTPVTGRQEQLNQTPLIDFPVEPPSCVDPDDAIPALFAGVLRNERTGRLECIIDGAELVVP